MRPEFKCALYMGGYCLYDVFCVQGSPQGPALGILSKRFDSLHVDKLTLNCLLNIISGDTKARLLCSRTVFKKI